MRLDCYAARFSIGVTNEGGSPSLSDRRPVHMVALLVLSVSKPVVGAPHASPKCALALTRLGGNLFLQALSCVCVVADCHSFGTTFVVAFGTTSVASVVGVKTSGWCATCLPQVRPS